jgi:hypothetical protein
MLTRPADLPDPEVVGALRTGWALEPVDVLYSAVGFGSHHWRIADNAGQRWFLSIDDLGERRRSTEDAPNDAYDRLCAALLSASAVHDSGATFVVAPVRTTDGHVLQRIRDRYAAALYPFIDGGVREFAETFTDTEREQVLQLIAALHTSSTAGVAQVEDFLLPQRDEIARALDELGTPWETGPYGQRARSWVADHASRIEQLLGEHDQLAANARQQSDQMVLTHGEPHPGNVIETPNGWMLVDWDTALIAPPERDLWHFGSAEPGTFDAYTKATGREVSQPMLDYYRLSWSLDDVASFAARFRRPHADTPDARAEWANMENRSL